MIGHVSSVDLVVVTHDSQSDLERCLPSLERAAKEAQARIVIVDNGSTDDTLAWVSARAEQMIDLVTLGSNRGYAHGVNVGAARSRADYLAVLNPDITSPRPDAITRLVHHLDGHPEAGAAAPRLLNLDGSLQSSARPVPTVGMLLARQTALGRTSWGRRRVQRYLAPPGDDRDHVAVEWVLGAAIVVRRADFERVGGWDERFFLYFEDVDFCCRLRALGREIHYLPDVSLVHDHRRASDRTRGPALRSALRRAHIRSALLFFAKHPSLLARRSRSASPRSA